MNKLANWIDCPETRERRKQLRWINEARGRFPVRDWVNFPICGYDRRNSRRG